MTRPIHATDDQGRALCGAKTNGKKTKTTSDPTKATCINCHRVVAGNERKADRPNGRARKVQDRADWAMTALRKAAKHAAALTEVLRGLDPDAIDPDEPAVLIEDAIQACLVIRGIGEEWSE